MLTLLLKQKDNSAESHQILLIRKGDWMKRWGLIKAILCLFIIIEPLHVFAAELFIDDSFLDGTKINPYKTTADVDTKMGWVTLSRKAMGNTVALYEDNYDITVINGQSVDTYRFNGTVMEKNAGLSIAEGLSDPIGVSAQTEGKYVVLDRADKRAITYQSNGMAMIENPYLTTDQLINPASVAALEDAEGYGVLEKDKINRYSYDGEKMVINNALSLALDQSTNSISFDISSKGLDYAVIDKLNNQILYYSFNGSSMAKTPQMSITEPNELNNPKSISIKNDGAYVVLDDDQVKAYNYDGNRMVFNRILSVEGLRKPVAVAVKPNSFDYAVLQLDSNDLPIICFYAFNGVGMEEIPELRITGLEDIPYVNNQVLMGQEVISSTSVTALRIIAEEELPEGTSITWEVTVDGSTWKTAYNNGSSIKFTNPGTKPNYRAILHTDNPHLSPKILNVCLINSSLGLGNFRIINIVGPLIPENPNLPTNQQVKIWAGYNVTFQIDTSGCAENVIADISFLDENIDLNSLEGTITPKLSLEEYNNIWEGTFHTPGNIPKNTSLDIFLTTNKDSEYEHFSYPDFAVIYGSAYERHRIHLTH